MKKTLITSVCLLIAFCCSITLNAQVKAEAKSIVGDWNYEAPDAPYGYDKGKMTFTFDDNKLSGEVIISGSKMKVNEVKFADNKYSCSLYVDGAPVDVEMQLAANDRLEGTAKVEGWELPLTLTRLK